MSIQPDWGKAPEGATHWEPAIENIIARWMKLEGFTWFFCPTKSDNPEWRAERMVTDWREARFVPRPASDWTGHDLPPVGAVCEACYTSPDEYYQAKVLVHDDGKAVYRWLDGPCVGDICESDNHVFCKISGPHPKFRPIRTPEQIAEEEREKAIREMRHIAEHDAHSRTVDYGALYDAGFRKTDQELVSALRSLAEAYRDVTGIDGAYGQEIRRAEEVLKRYE